MSSAARERDIICGSPQQVFNAPISEAWLNNWKAEIKANFDAYDKDGSGGVSREEVEAKVKERSAANKAKIQEQFASFASENGGREEVSRGCGEA